MSLKASWLFNGTAAGGKISFGFSESWYTDLAPDLLLQRMKEIARTRLRMCARNTVLFGYRIADTAPNSRAFTHRETANVQSSIRAGTPNVPQDAALCRCYGTVGGTLKRFWLHNLPDDMVEDGQFTEVGPLPTIARQWLNELLANGFKFRYKVPSAPTGRVQSIDSSGNVVLLEGIAGLAVSSLVQLLHVRDVNGRGVTGNFAVKARTSDAVFQLDHWPGGLIGMSGKIRLVQYAFSSIQEVPDQGAKADITIRPGSRKCGRPFGQLRGRVPARR